MREFFRGWKRKVGCVTLMLACVFAAGWVRSFFFYDCYVFCPEPHTTHTLASEGTYFIYQYSYERLPRTDPLIEWVNQRDPDPWSSLEEYFIDSTIKWYADFWLKCGEYPDFWSNGCRCVMLFVPYWSIVIPLTAVSGWLLLSKPRAKIEPPITPDSENA